MSAQAPTAQAAIVNTLSDLWRQMRARFSGNNSLVLITAGLFIGLYMIGAFVYRDKGFGSLASFCDMLNSYPGLIVVAAGLTMVIISGGIDISVGGQVAMYCMMIAYFVEKQSVSPYLMIVIVLVTGTVFGFVQGILISYFKLQPFIVTLAGMFMARGVTAMISSETIDISNEQFKAMAFLQFRLPLAGQPFIYLSVVIALIVLVAMFVLMTQTKFGRSVYAIGGSEQSSLLLGLNTRRTKLAVYTLNGFLTATGGFLYCLFSPGGTIVRAQGFEIQAIAAAVIGGAVLTGGAGSIFGSFIGVLVPATIAKFIAYNGTLVSGWSEIVTGAIMAFFIVLQAIVIRAQRKRE